MTGLLSLGLLGIYLTAVAYASTTLARLVLEHFFRGDR